MGFDEIILWRFGDMNVGVCAACYVGEVCASPQRGASWRHRPISEWRTGALSSTEPSRQRGRIARASPRQRGNKGRGINESCQGAVCGHAVPGVARQTRRVAMERKHAAKTPDLRPDEVRGGGGLTAQKAGRGVAGWPASPCQRRCQAPLAACCDESGSLRPMLNSRVPSPGGLPPKRLRQKQCLHRSSVYRPLANVAAFSPRAVRSSLLICALVACTEVRGPIQRIPASINSCGVFVLLHHPHCPGRSKPESGQNRSKPLPNWPYRDHGMPMPNQFGTDSTTLGSFNQVLSDSA